jgi:O-antigen/teichoic acid export membrane protein
MKPPPDLQNKPNQLKHKINRLFEIFSGKGARGGYLAAVDQGVISASNFLATIILARSVSPTELGVYAVGFISLRLTMVIQDGTIIQPLNTFGAPMEQPRFRRYATSTGILQIILALALAALAALGGWILTNSGNDTAGPAMFALWAPILCYQLQEYLRRTLYARGKIINATIVSASSNVVRLGLLIWWAGLGELSGVAGLNAIAFGALFAILPGLWLTRAIWSRRFYSLTMTWDRNWRFGRWITGGNIANWISVEFYPILTAGFISFAAAGAYRALQNLVAPIHLLLRAIDTYLTPRAAKVYREGGKRALSGTLRFTYLIAGIPTLILLGLALIFPKPLLQLRYGDTYLEYSPGIVLMAIFYALLYIKWPLQIVLKAARYSQPIFYANIAAMAAMFTIGIWAILQWGVYGTIAGQALNASIATVFLMAAWWRFERGEKGAGNDEV